MIHFRNMASRKKAGNGANGKQLSKHKDGPIGRRVFLFSDMFLRLWVMCIVTLGGLCGTFV